MKSINVNGCSVCQPGSENYCTYTTRLRGKKVNMITKQIQVSCLLVVPQHWKSAGRNVTHG